MKVIILGGFLGSGKTTALMSFARYLVDISDPSRENKMVILENEIGEVGVDDAYLRGGGFTVNNLFSGCACCTVSGELVSAMARIRSQLDPEWAVVETTGVAYPMRMKENLRDALMIESRICVLADVSRWKRLLTPMRELLRGQIVGANAVVLNKTDLSDEAAIAEVERDVLEFEPNSRIYRISAIGEVPERVWESVAGVSDDD
jgi:G3E family GTPase